jgi:NAD(P)-dependent dehydrogenase (short-subunit alcohol dehydrogenase family)
MKTFLVTGATGGLGLETVKNITKSKTNRVVMAVRDLNKGEKIAAELEGNIEVQHLDLSQLGNIRNFLDNWDFSLAGLINIAGVQFVYETSFTQDGYEETIAVNHLAAFLLTVGLIPFLKGGKVLFIGSGTHNPNYPLGKFFGFRGAQYTTLNDLIKGISDAKTTKQMNIDRYATSKLLNIITAVELSRKYEEFSSYVLDPGLMPGTGLARHQNSTMRFLWKKVMPITAHLLPDITTTRRSGKTAAWIMETSPFKFQSGEILSFNRKPYKYVWKDMALNEKIGKDVYESSKEIVKEFLP